MDEARYRARSLWLDGLAEPLTPRAALPGDRDCDVAIVGAGLTGLWAAYSLAALQPGIRVVVVEREIAGFGPSGRNGGWASAGIAGSAARYARLRGDDSVRRGERAMADAVGEIGTVIASEGIDCGWLHSGTLMVATWRPLSVLTASKWMPERGISRLSKATSKPISLSNVSVSRSTS